MAEKLAINVAGLVVDDRRPGRGKRGKCPVAAEPCAGGVGRHNSEMIDGVWTQPADVGSDVPIGVPSLSLHWGGGSISWSWFHIGKRQSWLIHED